MKVVQTFWSGSRTSITKDSFGWHQPEYHLQSWALSCQLLKRLYPEVELYTDKTGYDLLIKQLKLPYTNVHVVLDDLNAYSNSVWALSKIYTYSLQNTPFIHVDGDVFLRKEFSKELTASGLIVQNREIENRYFESSWKLLESQVFIDYLELENIKLDQKEFDFQIETHPNFPSLLAFHDALNFFKVPNIAVRIPNKDLSQLPVHFIAQVQGPSGSELALVEKKEDDIEVTFAEKKKFTLSTNDFKNTWSGIVLVAESDDHMVKSKSKKDVGFLVFSAISVLTMLFVSIPIAIFSAFIFAGIFFAKEAISQELSIDTNFSSKFCNISAQSDFSTVIKSDSFKLFGNIGLSDFSILYFSGQLLAFLVLLLTQAEVDFFLFTLFGSLLIVPVTLASIYYQWRIAKKWRVVCLAIISILYLQSGFSFWYYQSNELSFDFNTASLGLYLVSFLLVTIAWLSIKPFLNRFFELKDDHKKLFTFKRNYSMFKSELLSQKKTDYTSLPAHFIVGNPDAPLKLSIVTNPFCKYCKEAHFELDDLLKRHPDQLCLTVLFLFDLEVPSNDSSAELHYRLADIYMNEGDRTFMGALGDWFANKDYEAWSKKYGKFHGDKDVISNIFITQRNSHKENEVLFTPTITPGNYRYPQAYEKGDIPLFLQDLLEEDQDILLTPKKALIYAN